MTKNEAIEIIEGGEFANLTPEKQASVVAALKDNYDDFRDETWSCSWDSSNC